MSLMRIFLSYADPDREVASEFAKALSGLDLSVWLDKWEIVPGEDWHAQVSEALKASQGMVVLITPASSDSRSVGSEIDFALGHEAYRHRLVPVVVGDVKEESLPWILRSMARVRLEHPADPQAIAFAARQVHQVLEAADDGPVHAAK